MESRSPGTGGGGRTDGPASLPWADRHDDDDDDDDEGPLPPPGTHPCPSHAFPLLSTLSLDQIRVRVRTSNEYKDGPTLAAKPSGPQGPPGPRKDSLVLLATTTTMAVAPVTSAPLPRVADPGDRCRGPRLQSWPPSDGGSGEGDDAVRTQPKRGELLDATERKPLVAAAGGRHAERCADCGRCVCGECARPRPLPSCWLCGRRCVCSPQSTAEHATCVCCVRGLFYHCSSDDEDTCADKPFSCSPPHRCARWTAVALLTAALPCIACYLPAKACVAVCQRCHDAAGAGRPGCRCKGGARRIADKPT